MPRIPETAPKGFSDEERAKLVALPEPYGFVLRFLFGTGLRWGEGCRVQASHVKDGLEVERTKTGRVRRVPLGPALAGEVRGHVGRLVPFSSHSSFGKAVRKATWIADFHVHRTRHDFAIQWLRDWGSLAALKDILGHASIATTMRYARITEDLIKREAERRLPRARGGLIEGRRRRFVSTPCPPRPLPFPAGGRKCWRRSAVTR